MYKVLIRPLVVEDANTSWKWRNDPEVWAQTGNSPDKPITLGIEIEWIKKVIKDETTKRFAITVDDQYVGNVQLTDVTDSKAQFHIFIGEKSFWGRGIAKQATYQILNYAKEILKLTEVYLYVKKSNVFAIKVYKKNSFIIDEEDGGKIKMTCKLTDLKAPMVSIFCMVYNHEKYISDSIESFLMQKNNFNTVIVIGEDCSTDGSRNVINSYVERFPGKFRLLYHNVNVGANKNQEIVFQNCTGKYIAICEGDDYWTDPLKLQKQLDFLETNEDYGLVHTNHDILKNNQLIKESIKNKRIPEGDVSEELLYENFISTLTVCIRKEQLDKALSIVKSKYAMGDLPLWMAIAQNSKIGYLNCSTAVYRHVENSASHSTSHLKHFNFIKSAFQLKYDFIKLYNYKPKTIERVQTRYAKYLFKYAIVLNEPSVINEFSTFYAKHKNYTTRLYKILFVVSKNNFMKRLLLKFIV